MVNLEFVTPERVAQSMGALSAATGSGGANGDSRLAYFCALNQIQKREIPLAEHRDRPQMVFEFADNGDRSIVEHFLEVESLDGANLFSPDSTNRIREHMHDGWKVLNEYDRNAVNLAESLVARFLFARKPGCGGASTGDMLGCVWLSPPAKWYSHDYAEAILHESVHQALFLDEMVQRVYSADPPTLAHEDACIVSAIRKESRPFDASFHAACVAAAIVDLYQFLEMPERVRSLLDGLRPSIKELTLKTGYLTDHGQQILHELKACVD